MNRTCGHCKGSGVVEVTGMYAETLALLRRQRRELNAAELGRIAGVKNPAMANRLVGLERMGLATGRRFGRQRLWRATK